MAATQERLRADTVRLVGDWPTLATFLDHLDDADVEAEPPEFALERDWWRWRSSPPRRRRGG